MKIRHLAVTALLFTAACDSCGGCGAKKEEPAQPVKADGHAPPAMPAPGSDADQKRLDALALANKIDGELSTFKHDEKPMAPDKKAEMWWIEAKPEQPKKLIVTDNSGAATTYYFDEKGMLAYVRAADGHFVFRMEGLALWLDPEQRVKHGVKPQEASARAAALKKDQSQALTMFGLR